MRRLHSILVLTFMVLCLSSCERRSNVSVEDICFDDSSAFNLLNEISKIGPRHSGSDGALRNVQFIEKKLSEYGIPYFRDEWEEDSPAGRILFRNVVAQIGSTQERPFLILGAHYDTKKLDFCPGFQGSNDGASGVAILLESAKALWGKREKFRKNIEIVFFDGEECICAYSENDGLHGSKYHSRKSVAKNKKCEAVIIVDMLADKNLDAIIPVESDEKLASLFIETASEIGFSAHFTRVNTSMIDDHRPFIDAGMASLLLIDFNYGPNNVYWHSSGDNLSNTSRESLAITGKSIYLFILRLAIK